MNRIQKTVPGTWTGSVKIIEQFMNTGKPVEYGQCWVFSGVTTTLLRALGIPTRTVTNFESAHDHDTSMTIDKFLDIDGNVIKGLGDSIWNFHVWNECWFKRFDLPPGYDGWQVIDGTPQETSGGFMQCGPCPVRAVKEGNVYLNYDTPFVYAEVNGDEIFWKLNEEFEAEIGTLKPNTVGGNISTKAVGSYARHDLTDDYRYPHDSPEDKKVRALVSGFSRYSENIRDKYEDKYGDFIPETEIEITLKCPKKSRFGDDFSVEALIENTSTEERRVSLSVNILHCHYTGVAGERVLDEHFRVTVGAKSVLSKTITVPSEKYKSFRNPEARFQVYLTAKNEFTNGMHVKDLIVELAKPKIQFKVPENVEYMKETDAIVMIKNTTLVPLTNCKFRIEGTSALDEVLKKREKSLEVDEEWSVTVTLKPKKKTMKTGSLLATFQSEELVGIRQYSDTFKVVNLPPLRTD